MDDFYLIVKCVHIIAIICWMAGLFYLPRLFVYHASVDPFSSSASLFQIMEHKLYMIIMTPSMIFSLASGAFLATVSSTWSSGWMHLKLISILALVIFHFTLNHWRHLLALGTCQRSSGFFRLINEIPTILLIVIVTSVVLKPF